MLVRKTSDPNFNFLKEVWRFMQAKQTVSQQELREKISMLNGKSNVAAFYLVQMLCKPIQIGAEFKNGKPSVRFVQEPLIVEVPSMGQTKNYALENYWRDLVTESNPVFEKAKRFYQ